MVKGETHARFKNQSISEPVCILASLEPGAVFLLSR